MRRDPDAENKELGSSAFRGFSDFIMKDNWWHVRCLFRGVGLFVAKHVPAQHTKTAKVKVESGERTVAVLIAMIGGGAKDSLPWVLTMDHYLRVLWTGIKEFFTSETPNELRQLFTELVTWVHGTIIVAYILRCRTRTGPANVVVSCTFHLLPTTSNVMLTSYRTNGTSCCTSATRLAQTPTVFACCLIRIVSTHGTSVAFSLLASVRPETAAKQSANSFRPIATSHTTACTTCSRNARK